SSSTTCPRFSPWAVFRRACARSCSIPRTSSRARQPNSTAARPGQRSRRISPVNAPEAIPETDAALLALAQRLTAEAGRGAPRALPGLAGGRNNRVSGLDPDAGPLVLKLYFRDARDNRDRLGAEWSFIRHAWSRGIRVVPEPLASTAAEQAGLY